MDESSGIAWRAKGYVVSQSFKVFIKMFFKEVYNQEFIFSYHHEALIDYLTHVYNGDITRLIINMPPRYGKSIITSILFPAWCFSINAESKFIHTSYSEDLALLNSQLCKEIVQNELYKKMYNFELAQDSTAKKYWKTKAGGSFYAVSSGGQITGFGAGAMNGGEFAGAILIDDPVKPKDGDSDVVRNSINQWYNRTLASRINNAKTPIVCTMQRLHEEDLAGFLLGGGSGERWELLKLAAITEEGKSLWHFKYSIEELQRMKKSDPFMFAGQYQQEPAPEEGGIFKIDYWNRHDAEPQVEYKIMTCDTAWEKGKENDYTVFQIWGKRLNMAYLIDQLKFKADVVDIEAKFVEFYKKHYPRICYIEKAASGIALIQNVKRNYSIPVMAIVRGKESKIQRARNIIGFVASGLISIPMKNSNEWIDEYLQNMKNFPNAKHDDEVDCTIDAIGMLLNNQGVMVYPDFNRQNHVVNKVEHMPIYPLRLAFWLGEHPVCIIYQITNRWQIRVMKCITSDNFRRNEFIKDIKFILDNEFEGVDNLRIISNEYCSDIEVIGCRHGVVEIDTTDHRSYIEKTSEILQANIVNDMYLNEGKFQVSSECDILIKSMEGGLRYEVKDNQLHARNVLVADYPHHLIGNCLHMMMYDTFLMSNMAINSESTEKRKSIVSKFRLR